MYKLIVVIYLCRGGTKGLGFTGGKCISIIGYQVL
jgi:hypothetical protein